MLLGWLVLVVGAVLHLLGRRSASRMEREYSARRPPGADGVLPGAGPLAMRRSGRRAVLLLHGGGDTPQTLRYLAEHLHERGYCVRAPLLPGHGRTLADFASPRHANATAWLEAARAEYEDLRRSHEWVAIVGLSMGGAIAVRLAAGRSDVPALVLVAPYLQMPPKVRRAALLSHFWGAFRPYVESTDGISIHDPREQARSLAYGYFTPAALRALAATVEAARNALPHVSAPTLVINSRQDNRIPVAAAEEAYARLGAPEKRLQWVEGAGHVITVDYGRDAVFEDAAAWLLAHHGPPRPWVRPRRTRAEREG